MKKIFYSLIIFVSLFAFVLLLSNRVNSSNAENLICSAETTPTTQNVNFYGSDNETLLYTAKVPYGSTLNSVKSKNLLPNSPYYSSSFSGVQTIIQGNSLSYNGSATGSANVYDAPYVYLDRSLPIGDYTVSLKYVDGSVVGSNQYRVGVRFVYDDGSSHNFEVYNVHQGNLVRTVNVVKPIVAFKIIGTFYINTYYNITYDIMVSQGSSAIPFEPYYDDLNEYVNEQYLKSAGVSDLSTPVSWSTSKESNNMFPFNVPITQDYNLYGYVNDGETITYEGELTSRVSDIGNYALTDIVSLNIEGKYVVRGTYTVTESNKNAFKFVVPVVASNYNLGFDTVNAIVFNSNSDYFDMNLLITSIAKPEQLDNPSHYSDNIVGLGEINADAGDYSASLGYKSIIYTFDSSSVGSSFYFYFSTTAFKLYDSKIDNSIYTFWGFDETSNYTKDTNYMFTENLDYLVDMNSNTNFSYSLITEENKSPFYSHNTNDYLSYVLFSQQKQYDLQPYSDRWYFDSKMSVKVLYDDIFTFSNFSKMGCSTLTFNGVGEMQYNYDVNDYYFIVDKPTYRVNNALLLYNFDYYNTLYNVNSVIYELSKNGDYYDIVYNGTLPNYKYMYIDNEQINNTIFDRYIFVHFTFNNNNIINLLENGEYVPYYVGFDFNFAYYVEPLISDSSTFEYDFDKPKYKDTGDIFNINWLAVVYNIVVFIAFYMPLVSHVFEMLGLNYFFGGLLNVISFIFDNPLGNFLLGCLAFIIFFKLMLWFWPMAWEVKKQAFNTIKEYHSVNKDYKNDLKRQKRWNDRKLKFRHYGNLKASQRRKLSQVYFTRNYRKSVDTRNFHSLHGKHYGHLKYSQIKGRKNYFNKKPVFIGTKKKSK